MTRVLGIETSCDETAAAVVEDGERLLSNVIASQVNLHARYGGVVPEVAARKHLESIIPVIETALEQAGCTWHEIAAIAATQGPGLPGSLLVGFNTAKAIAYARDLPLIPLNHLEGHVYANWLLEARDGGPAPVFPAVSLIVSGGHTDLMVMYDHGVYERLGRTRDDAAGEAFDKVARLLGLGFPGGPLIERAAREATSRKLELPRAWLHGTYDFSFSGLKTAVLRLVREHAGSYSVAEIAAAFQDSIIDVLVTKTIEAAVQVNARMILLSGGVAANRALKAAMEERSPVPVRVPPPHLCTDNGAMIAAAGYFHYGTGLQDMLAADVVPSLRLE